MSTMIELFIAVSFSLCLFSNARFQRLAANEIEILQEDDILMMRNQAERFFAGYDRDAKRRHRRSVRIGDDYRWELPIRYRISDSFDDKEKEVIYAAIREWQKQTCVQFSELPPSMNYTKPFLVFQDSRSLLYGCLSFIGNNKMRYGQPVLLGRKCFDQLGRLLHEVGHVLGLVHEHMRPIRDDFVTVKAPITNVNFQKVTTTEYEGFGITYDFNSVMHYPLMDSDMYQLKPKDMRYFHNIGQRAVLSFLDVQKINMAYCQDSCKNSRYPTPRCEHGGYQNPTRCYKCHCPEGFGGLRCQSSAWYRRARCGGQLELTENAFQAIWSPGYIRGVGYKVGTQCNWIIKVPTGYRVALRFHGEFSIPDETEATCNSWVEIKPIADFGIPGYRFCGVKSPRSLYLSEKEEMAVVFRIPMTKDIAVGRGFFAQVYRVPGTKKRRLLSPITKERSKPS